MTVCVILRHPLVKVNLYVILRDPLVTVNVYVILRHPLVKGTVCVILRHPLVKEGNAQITSIPFKPWTDHRIRVCMVFKLQ